MQHVRALKEHEGQLLKGVVLRMCADTPTAYGETLAKASGYTDEQWQQYAAMGSSGVDMAAFVAEESGEGYGFAMGTILPKQTLAELMGPQDAADLDGPSDTTILSRMWVAPHMRRQGVGRELIQAVISWAEAQGQRRVILAVTEGNDIAEQCYVRAGFVGTGNELPHPWHPELKVYFMAKEL